MSRNHPVNVEKPGAIIIESVRNLIDTNPRKEFKIKKMLTSAPSGYFSVQEIQCPKMEKFLAATKFTEMTDWAADGLINLVRRRSRQSPWGPW